MDRINCHDCKVGTYDMLEEDFISNERMSGPEDLLEEDRDELCAKTLRLLEEDRGVACRAHYDEGW